MALDFDINDIIHRISVKFAHGYLPELKKPYYLKTVHQTDLDIHAIASKADVYNIETSPKVIEEGFSAAVRLMKYLLADGYRIKTPLFTMRLRFPGEYDGTETQLNSESRAEVRLQPALALRKYVQERVQVEFDGIDQAEGHIGEVIDESTGQIDEVISIGKLITIRGTGLKIDSDQEHADEVGLYFNSGEQAPQKAQIIAVNEPKTIKAIVPATLSAGNPVVLRIVTQTSAKGHHSVVKELRTVVSDFSLMTQA